jgi:hypothetical protein
METKDERPVLVVPAIAWHRLMRVIDRYIDFSNCGNA